MQQDIAQIGYEIDGDGSLERGRRNLSRFADESQNVERATERVNSRFSRLEDRAARVSEISGRLGRQISIGLTAPLIAAAAASANLAINAQETANRFEVVFRGSVSSVNAELELLHENIPLTTTQMRDLSSGVQDLLVPLGLAREEAAGLSVDALRLAGDLGSFNNAGTEQVLDAIRSSLTGSSEPMRRFGVDTRETRLQTIALNQGLIQQGEELSGAARAQAVFAAITADSSDAIGDAARTAEDNAAQLRFIRRDVLEASEAIGNDLLPVVSDIITEVRSFTQWLASLDQEARQNIILWGGIAAAIGPALIGISAITRAVITLRALLIASNPFLLIATGLGVAAGSLVLFGNAESRAARETEVLADRIDSLNSSVNGLNVTQLRADFIEAEGVITGLQSRLGDLEDTLSTRFDTIGEGFREFPEFEALNNEISEITNSISEWQQRQGRVITQIGELEAAEDEAAAATDKLKDQIQGLSDNNTIATGTTEELKDEIESLLSEIEQSTISDFDRDLLQLNLALEESLREGHTERAERIANALDILSQRGDQLTDVFNDVPSSFDEAGVALDDYSTAFERGIERLDDIGANFWRDFFEDGKFNLRGIRDLFLDTLAELANAALTRPILLMFGFGGSGSAFAGQAGIGGGLAGIRDAIFGQRVTDDFVGPPQPGLLQTGGQNLGTLGQAGFGAGVGFGAGQIANLLGIGGFSTTGSTIGGGIGGALPIPIPFVGEILGSLLGGVIGNLFGSSPRLQVGGIESGIDTVGRGEAVFDTALGGVGVNTRGSEVRGELDNIRNAITDFDQSLADIVGNDNLGAVRSALDSFFIEQGEDDINLEEVLRARFNTSVSALDSEVQLAVTSVTGTLEEQFQRLSDVLAIQGDLSSGNDILGTTLTSVINLTDDLSQGNETLGETYNRLLVQTDLFNNAVQDLQLNFDGTTEEIVRAADNLALLFGGLNEFSSAIAEFQQIVGGPSAEDVALRAARAVNDFNNALGATDDSIIDTREELRDYVQGLDLSTQAGREAFQTAVELAGSIAIFEDFTNSLIGQVSEIQEFADSDILEDYARGLEGAQRTLTDLLSESGSTVQDALSAYDGSTESVERLNSAVRNRYALELQFIAQLDNSIRSVLGQLANTRQNIEESLLSDNEIYARRRDEIASLSESISTADTPEQLQEIGEAIDRLTNDAFGRLSEQQQQIFGPGFLEFLDQISNDIANRGQELRSSFEEESEALRNQAGEVLGDVDLQFIESVNMFDEAVQDFGEIIGSNDPSSPNPPPPQPPPSGGGSGGNFGENPQVTLDVTQQLSTVIRDAFVQATTGIAGASANAITEAVGDIQVIINIPTPDQVNA